jgi:anti-sigma-K factor RskA
MSRELKRYQLPEVVEHLASHYVLGSLPIRVQRRVETLRRDVENDSLNARIQFWENSMSPLNEKISPLEPKASTWENIHAELNSNSRNEAKQPWYALFTPRFYQWATACSLMLVALLSVSTLNQSDSVGALSYVAVLADDQQKPQLVAATYGESQTLLLDIVQLPEVQEGETLELWVTSKTDFQTRSLGEIPLNVASFSRKLSNAEWRLIKDSDSLLLSIEEAGGSAIGEPMGAIVSKGACVRLSGWQEQV